MGFVFGGISSNEMKIKARITSWQVLPDIANNTQTISGKAGVADYGCTSKARIINVSCNIYPQKSFGDLVEVLDDVAAWLDPEEGVKQLIFDEIPDRYFEARINGQVDCERILRSAGSFELSFLCPDPYSYAVKDENFTVEEEGSTVLIRQLGNKESYPVYHLSGVIPSGDAYIKINTNGQVLNIRGPLAEGEVLIIDTSLLTAKVVDEAGETLRNGLPLMENIEFPVLNKGRNELAITCEGAASFVSLRVQAKSRWR